MAGGCAALAHVMTGNSLDASRVIKALVPTRTDGGPHGRVGWWRSEAERWFARARGVEEACGHRPARALVDIDEATTLIRQSPGEHRQAVTLIEAGLSQFTMLEMEPWIGRRVALRSRPSESSPV
jgi:hypothetical protein